jgi:hypothetical protein
MSRHTSLDYKALEQSELPLNRKTWFKIAGSNFWHKRCSRCFEILPLERFVKNVRTPDMLHYGCRSCYGTEYLYSRIRAREEERAAHGEGAVIEV